MGVKDCAHAHALNPAQLDSRVLLPKRADGRQGLRSRPRPDEGHLQSAILCYFVLLLLLEKCVCKCFLNDVVH